MSVFTHLRGAHIDLVVVSENGLRARPLTSSEDRALTEAEFTAVMRHARAVIAAGEREVNARLVVAP